ncbi:MAG: agmatinase [Flavobacteriales bacterium]|nr:agmatinase [Flavobacteriales bacterium]
MRYYCNIPIESAAFDKAPVILQSIPFDGTSTWGKGADKGFIAFMDATDNMEVYDIETDSEIYRRGIHVLEEFNGLTDPSEMFTAVYARTKELISLGKMVTSFGGEHSVSIPLIRAHYESYPDVSVLQLDAHADLRPTYLGTPYNHACALYDASQQCNLVQVGIRSAEREELKYAQKGNVFWAQEMLKTSTWMRNSLDRLGENVYITIDLDVFDPSILPGTGTPEPGGLGWYEVLDFLRSVFANKNVLGFDIVELAPIPGHRSSEFLAAKLYYKMLSYYFDR